MGYANKASILTLATAGALLLGTGAALAADASAAWSGPYVGVSIGGGFQDNDWKAKSVGPDNIFGVADSSRQATLDQAGGRFGGYAGWNLPVSPVVIVGLEADIAGIVGGKKTLTGMPGVDYQTALSQGAVPADGISARADWDASLRARVGYLLDPALLVYGTTGVAFLDSEYKANCPATGMSSWCASPESGSISKTSVGWTVGAGAEGRVADNWSVRVEYRYAGFSGTTLNFFSGYDAYSAKTDPSSHIVTFGLTYHFGNI
ncbi:outer membrane beta-barrel protein [Telmatospirillum sp.]|uniref:outer membrane protein n=1 Tax=Telmatospirillum sp. TaxID=2079197 RepID=UPI00284B42E2|nr:outer membrane beta-barrel protein [Telmatospirillum sp.]MDR3440042.1 outer membrane beta-barrel protein [Telmatospirillum sp.]